MPVSRRRKAGRAAPPALPTRAMRVAYLATTSPGRLVVDLQRAGLVLDKGLDEEWDPAATSAALRALAICPVCVPAFEVLADREDDVAVAIDVLRRGRHAAELLVGDAGFAPGTAPLGDDDASVDMLRMTLLLAETLLEADAGEAEAEALDLLRSILRLDPADRLRARYVLLPALLDQHDVDEAQALTAAFLHDESADWLYGRALLAFRQERQAAPGTLALVARAIAANPRVPGLLTALATEEGPAAMAEDDDAALEAMAYCDVASRCWHNTPGALAWLTSLSQFP